MYNGYGGDPFKKILDTKITTLMNKKIEKNQKFFGMEISSKTIKTINYESFKTQPSFTSLVWDGVSEAAIKIAESIQSKGGIVLPHISCFQMTSEKLNEFFEHLNSLNVLVIRGDVVDPDQEFIFATDLVKKIKLTKKDSICVGVCGYPDMHPDAKSIDDDLRNLKFKVDSGADFILTQLCFSTETIKTFIKNCREIGIVQPIIPGIFAPSSWAIFDKMLKYTEVPIDKDLLIEFQQFQDDDEGFKNLATTFFTNMVKDLFESKDLECNGVHFFTFNNFEVAQRIVNELF